MNKCIIANDVVIPFRQIKYIPTWHANNIALQIRIDKYILWYDLNLFYIVDDKIYKLTDKLDYYKKLYNDDILLMCNLIEDKVNLIFIAKEEAYTKHINDITKFATVKLVN